MCGILASFNSRFSKDALINALDLMDHRGPDYTGIKFFENNFLGHKRLSIIDINERSNQPYTSDEYHIIYNGEIYNYKELILDHSLVVQTDSDTEVVLEMFKKYGARCVDFFNGMFAFVIYNEKKDSFFVARDRLGIKPLYFREKNGHIDFSSEVASLLHLEESPLDDFGIRQYRKLRMTVGGYTVYSDIKMFPPGHYYENGKLVKYWQLEVIDKEDPNDDELKALIEDAVLIRKRADVSLGSYLSGGLDSTILSHILKPSHTWTVGFEELNEFEWSTLANEKLDSKLNQLLVDPKSFISTGQFLVKKRREPLSVPNEILIYLMTKEVKAENTVVLSGEGADELFWGYDRIFHWAKELKSIELSGFDSKYCYGTHKDDEVLDFALEGIAGKTPLEKIGYYFQITHLQGLLRRLDNSTMMCSVEARVPFVDHRLVEMMSGASFDWRMGSSFKEPLKRLFKNELHNDIINRKKIGFPVPLENIFREQLDNQTTPMDAWLDFNLNNLEIK